MTYRHKLSPRVTKRELPTYAERPGAIVFTSVADFEVPLCRAGRELIKLAADYQIIADLPAAHRRRAMRRIERPYLFERNTGRWPDGLYYLLNRGYQPWRGHKIGLTLDECLALHLDRWYRSEAVQVGTVDRAFMIVDDVLQERPGSWLPYLARLVYDIGSYVEGRARKGGAA